MIHITQDGKIYIVDCHGHILYEYINEKWYIYINDGCYEVIQ